ncbi:MAG: hypothetical protein ONA69_05695, partial [candidate division KSB1 bacterium]|nr:hypothetical protein [candidate division KSB1 bacterium]
MRKRRWALFLFMFLIAFLFGAMETWRLFQANERLRRVIVGELRPLIGQGLRIKKVHLGFGNIHLLDVQFKDPALPFEITIKDLRLGYSFLNLVTRGFDVKKLSHDALLIEPTLVATLPKLDAFFATLQTETQAERSTQAEPLLFRHFHFVSLKKCRVVIAVDESTTVEAARSLEGGLFRYRNDSLSIDLSGSLGSSDKKNFMIVGRADVRNLRPDTLTLVLHDFDLGNGIVVPQKLPFNFKSGRLTASVQIRTDPTSQRFQLRGQGEIARASGWAYQRSLEFNDLSCSFTYESETLNLLHGSLMLTESPITFSGSVGWSEGGRLGLEVHSPRLALSGLPIWPKDKVPAGWAEVHLKIAGDRRDPEIDGQITCNNAQLGKNEITNLSAFFRYQRSAVTFSHLEASLFGHHLKANGRLIRDGSDWAITGAAAMKGDKLLHASIGGQVVNVSGKGEALISGTLSDPVFSGVYSLFPSVNFGHSAELPFPFTYRGSVLNFRNTETTQPLNIVAEIQFGGQEPTFKVQIDALQQLFQFVKLSTPFQEMVSGLSISLAVEGIPSAWRGKTFVQRSEGEQDEEVVLAIEADAGVRNKATVLKGVCRLFPARFPYIGTFRLVRNEERLVLEEFKFDNIFSAGLDLNLRKRSLKGKMNSRALDLGALLGSDLLRGYVTAQLQLEGPANLPNFQGNLSIDELTISGLGPYQMIADLKADQDKIQLYRLLFNAESTTLLMAQGYYDRSMEQVDLSIKGAGFRAENVHRLVNRDTIIAGQTLVDLSVRGKLTSPKIQGIIALKDGRVWKSPFDELEIHLKNEDGDNKRVRFDSIRLLRQDVYQITASGYWPFAKNDSLAFNISGSGNLLAVLSDMDKFFKKPYGDGSFSVLLRGTPANPRIRHAELSLTNASLEFGSVVPPVKKVEAKLRYEPETGIFKLYNLSGLMGGEPFRIYSEAAQFLPCSRPLADFSFGDGLFNLGVLVLETPGNGVPLNFVGLMEPQKFGLLQLSGRENGEKFYFARTEEGVTLRGTILLSEAEIMYPFYESGNKPSEKVQHFLDNLIWDLAVVPQKNVRFARSFPAAIDEVYVNLKLDDRVGGLEFTGRIADETFRIKGSLRSTKGFLEYLDMNFRLEQAGVDFDRSSLIPVVYGQARTTITDSLGLSSNIFLSMQTVDNTMDKKSVDDIVRQEEGRARIDRIRFKLSSDNPMLGSNEAQVLS